MLWTWRDRRVGSPAEVRSRSGLDVRLPTFLHGRGLHVGAVRPMVEATCPKKTGRQKNGRQGYDYVIHLKFNENYRKSLIPRGNLKEWQCLENIPKLRKMDLHV